MHDFSPVLRSVLGWEQTWKSVSGNPHIVLKLCSGTYLRHSCPFMALNLSSWLCEFIYIILFPKTSSQNFKVSLFPSKTRSICLPCLQLHWHWALHHRWSVWRSARWPPWWYQGIFHHLYSACHSFQPEVDCSAWLQLGSLDESMREPGHMANTQQNILILVEYLNLKLKAIFFKMHSMKINTFLFISSKYNPLTSQQLLVS